MLRLVECWEAEAAKRRRHERQLFRRHAAKLMSLKEDLLRCLIVSGIKAIAWKASNLRMRYREFEADRFDDLHHYRSLFLARTGRTEVPAVAIAIAVSVETHALV